MAPSGGSLPRTQLRALRSGAAGSAARGPGVSRAVA